MNAPPRAVPPGRLEAHVRALAEEFTPRDHAHPENLERAAAYIAGEFAGTGAQVVRQAFRAGQHRYLNVVASFGPETPERVVVGAHYDAAGPYPGADDNASGTAGAIEVAHLLAGARLMTRVDVVAYPLEEPPYYGSRFMGSAVHVRTLRKAGARVRAMICLEMIGCFTDEPQSQRLPSPLLRPFYPSRGNFITVVGRLSDVGLTHRVKRAMARAAPLPVKAINAPRWVPGVDLSDHLNYWKAGYPAVMVTDTAFYRNPNYHTAYDTPDTLDYERMAQVVQGVHAAVLDLV